MKNANKVLNVDAGGGQVISVVGDTYRLIITGEQTDDAFAVIDMLIPPNGGPGPHAHADFQESFYVLEGEIVVKTKDETYTAGQGSFVRIPLGGVVHNFKNMTDKPAKLLCIVVPSGLEKFFQEIGKPAVEDKFFSPPQPMTPDEQKQIEKIAEKYGQKLYPPDFLD